MIIILDLHAAQPARQISLSPNFDALHQQLKKKSNEDCKESVVKNGQDAFGKKVEKDCQKRIEWAFTEIKKVSEGKDKTFWMKIFNAYEKLDIRALERLQNEKKPESVQEQMLIIDFICAVQSALDKQQDGVAIASMTDIKKGTFFKQITTAENSTHH